MVAGFLNRDGRELDQLGEVGFLTGPARDYLPIWQIVDRARIPLTDIEAEWTYDRIEAYRAYMNMTNDYKSAWEQLYRDQAEQKRE